MIFLFIVARLFYGRNIIFGLIISPIGIVIYKVLKRKYYENEKRKLEAQFKDLLVSISDLMQAGYSIENAITNSYNELLSIYGGDSLICKEIKEMNSKIKLNVNIETIIESFSKKYEVESINTFYQTFMIAKRTGGNMKEIIRNVTDSITLKERIKEEIEVSMNSQRLEQKVMMVIPIFLMIYVSFASPGFLDVMYQTMIGKIIMTICLIGYLVSYLWGEKITNIEV